MPGRKGPTNYARFVAFYSGCVSGQAPGFNPGSVITDFWVRMARQLGTVYAILYRLLLRQDDDDNDNDVNDGCAPRRGRGRRNRLKHQIARMLSGRDSNYYYHLLATGIALPRMITRGGWGRAAFIRRRSFRLLGAARRGQLFLSSFECDLEIASDAQSIVISRYLRHTFLKILCRCR